MPANGLLNPYLGKTTFVDLSFPKYIIIYFWVKSQYIQLFYFTITIDKKY